MRFVLVSLALGVLWSSPLTAQYERPRSHDKRIKIELFAESPQIVTPTGIDVDYRGRVFAIESNTHFRPADYKGHASDRVLVMSDTDRDGKADRIVTFADGLTFTMSVATPPIFPMEKPKAGPITTPVYVATRKEIFVMFDEDGDDQADRKQRLVHLETTGNYPHNGLAGFAFDAMGWMYFGFGENLGADYKVIGADGTTLAGGGEGGNIYRTRLDGTKLEHWATGFWNPHASCVDAFGRLFTVDNDPDSRPPCRLLHIIPGGDYGYRFRNGRKGLHPFTSWNGELPGTLPMVAGTGEAPSGILAYESDGLPSEYAGNLLVTSWGDHRIDRFRLQPKGVSFTALAEPVITGGENFRPVGIAIAPDGSLYCTDWVSRDYNLHGKGRIWRISATIPSAAASITLSELTPEKTPLQILEKHLSSRRMAVRRKAAQSLASTSAGRAELSQILRERKGGEGVEALWALASAFGTQDRTPLSTIDVFAVCDEVLDAAGPLINSPPLPVDQETLRRFAGVGKNGGLDARCNRPALASILSQCDLKPQDELVPTALSGDDPFILSVMVSSMAKRLTPTDFARYLSMGSQAPPRVKIAALLAARRHSPKDESVVTLGLADPSPGVRRLAVQWVAEERIKEFKPRVEAIFNDPEITADLFLATLAALEMLDGVNPSDFDKTPPGKYVLPLVRNEKRPASVRAHALCLVSPADPALDGKLLASLLATSDPVLKRETVRTLQTSPIPEATELLHSVAADEKMEKSLRADAIAGLAVAAKSADAESSRRQFLLGMLKSPDSALRTEALRSLRGLITQDEVRQALGELAAGLAFADKRPTLESRELADQLALAWSGKEDDLPKPAAALRSPRPRIPEGWDTALSGPADAAAGLRVFFHANSAGCSRCHTVNGRGGQIGPDLSTIGHSLTREKLLRSILEPSTEVAPQFVNWSLETREGKVHTGLIVFENEGKTTVGNAAGELIELKTASIVERVPQKTSVMPDKLAERMTLQEFRDLLAFLESLK